MATTGRLPVESGPYRVALRVISAQLSSDPGVASVREGPVSRDGHSTSLAVSLASDDDAAREQATKRLEAGIDPGPLRVAFGGEVPALLDARDDLSGDFWKLELLVVPVALLVLVGALGPRLAIAPALCAATAIAGALAGLRIAGALADVSLLGIAPAAVLGLALGIEAPCLLAARFRDEVASVRPDEALRRTVVAAGELALPLGLAATAATAGLLATTLDQAPSMWLACVLATVLALGSALVCVPALLALAWRGSSREAGRLEREPRLAWLPRTLAAGLAGSGHRTVLVAALVIAAMAAAAVPLGDAASRPFSAADLPAKSEASKAERITAAPSQGAAAPARDRPSAEAATGQAGDSVFGKLPLAAAISAVALAVALAAFFSPRAIPVAVVTLLPAAAACGLCVLVFQDGHLAGALGQRRQGALETGAVASLLAALVSISAIRAVAALRTVRGERALGLSPALAADTTATLTVPAAICGTLIAGAATAVLTGSDLYPAREFGAAVAAGLVIDLLLLRVPLIAALARWGGSD